MKEEIREELRDKGCRMLRMKDVEREGGNGRVGRERTAVR